MSLDRVNEMRYGGHRSGMVTADWGDHIRSVYDGVFDLEVRDTRREVITGRADTRQYLPR